MKCQNCDKGKMTVTDSRANDGGVRRTRVCDNCGFRMYTMEIEKERYKRLLKIEKQWNKLKL